MSRAPRPLPGRRHARRPPRHTPFMMPTLRLPWSLSARLAMNWSRPSSHTCEDHAQAPSWLRPPGRARKHERHPARRVAWVVVAGGVVQNGPVGARGVQPGHRRVGGRRKGTPNRIPKGVKRAAEDRRRERRSRRASVHRRAGGPATVQRSIPEGRPRVRRGQAGRRVPR